MSAIIPGLANVCHQGREASCSSARDQSVEYVLHMLLGSLGPGPSCNTGLGLQNVRGKAQDVGRFVLLVLIGNEAQCSKYSLEHHTPVNRGGGGSGLSRRGRKAGQGWRGINLWKLSWFVFKYELAPAYPCKHTLYQLGLGSLASRPR